jgi:hypothetical protein
MPPGKKKTEPAEEGEADSVSDDIDAKTAFMIPSEKSSQCDF